MPIESACDPALFRPAKAIAPAWPAACALDVSRK